MIYLFEIKINIQSNIILFYENRWFDFLDNESETVSRLLL